MDYSAIFQVSRSGMATEKLRLDITAVNLANVSSSTRIGSAPFQPLRVVSTARAAVFDALMDQSNTSALGVRVVSIEQEAVAPRLVHEPGHPDADEQGYVRYAGVDHLTEMVNMGTALRAYDANVAALNALKGMATRALDIGGAS